jgi:nicotinamidase/pyrazinamidase
MEFDTTASFDVDCQKGFTPLCPNELPVPGGDEIVEALNTQAKLCQYRIGSKDLHPIGAAWTMGKPFTPTKGYGPNVDMFWPAHCVIGTAGCDLLPGLPPEIKYDFFVYKGMNEDCHPYGACYHDLEEKQSTGVIEWLREHGIDTIIVGGLATDYCVKTTAIQLRKAGFEVIVNLQACRGINAVTCMEATVDMTKLGIRVVEEL